MDRETLGFFPSNADQALAPKAGEAEKGVITVTRSFHLNTFFYQLQALQLIGGQDCCPPASEEPSTCPAHRSLGCPGCVSGWDGGWSLDLGL